MSGAARRMESTWRNSVRTSATRCAGVRTEARRVLQSARGLIGTSAQVLMRDASNAVGSRSAPYRIKDRFLLAKLFQPIGAVFASDTGALVAADGSIRHLSRAAVDIDTAGADL